MVQLLRSVPIFTKLLTMLFVCLSLMSAVALYDLRRERHAAEQDAEARLEAISHKIARDLRSEIQVILGALRWVSLRMNQGLPAIDNVDVAQAAGKSFGYLEALRMFRSASTSEQLVAFGNKAPRTPTSFGAVTSFRSKGDYSVSSPWIDSATGKSLFTITQTANTEHALPLSVSAIIDTAMLGDIVSRVLPDCHWGASIGTVDGVVHVGSPFIHAELLNRHDDGVINHAAETAYFDNAERMFIGTDIDGSFHIHVSREVDDIFAANNHHRSVLTVKLVAAWSVCSILLLAYLFRAALVGIARPVKEEQAPPACHDQA